VREPLRFRLKVAALRQFPAQAVLFRTRKTDQFGDAAEPEKYLVTLRLSVAAQRREIDQRLRTEVSDRRVNGEDLSRFAHAHRVVHIPMNQARVTENHRRRRRFGVDWNIGEQTAFRVGKGAGNLVEAGKRDHRVAETPEAIDEDAPDLCPSS
jgi:hypothetical protein